MGVRGVRRRGKEKKKRREGEKTKIERGREEVISPNHQHPVPRRGRLREFRLAQEMLSAFHNVGGDMKQLLQIVDDGQVVDIKGISERSLIKHLNKLFISLNLKENGDMVFLLPPNVRPSLDVVGPLIQACAEPKEQQLDHSFPSNDVESITPDTEHKQETNDNNVAMPSSRDDASAPRRRVIGFEMPSAELLAATAKLTEAQAELSSEEELEEDTELLIGPAPPAIVAEAPSANEVERLEEVVFVILTKQFMDWSFFLGIIFGLKVSGHSVIIRFPLVQK
ncbi:hypothetical protein POTOM_045627 [Populus tomentosa]|uniref:Uncharacterized protein n=1 Tax=Populus tomentosa TaxID=118781 RepID=A0A8X7YH94_POPTO|nr:hypothetical protein POTOM_045627 [Populus tomentosa]